MRWHTPALRTDTDVVSRASVKRNKTARATRKEDFKWKCFSRHLKEVAEQQDLGMEFLGRRKGHMWNWNDSEGWVPVAEEDEK